MLDVTTDDASTPPRHPRGKVPDPKSQVEQITIALIYKFMDDHGRREARKLGGERKFFAGDFARYGWVKLCCPASALRGPHVYAEAIAEDAGKPGHPAALPGHLQERLLAPIATPRLLRASSRSSTSSVRSQRAPGRRLRVPALGFLGLRAMPDSSAPPPYHRLHVEIVDPRRRESRSGR